MLFPALPPFILFTGRQSFPSAVELRHRCRDAVARWGRAIRMHMGKGVRYLGPARRIREIDPSSMSPN